MNSHKDDTDAPPMPVRLTSPQRRILGRVLSRRYDLDPDGPELERRVEVFLADLTAAFGIRRSRRGWRDFLIGLRLAHVGLPPGVTLLPGLALGVALTALTGTAMPCEAQAAAGMIGLVVEFHGRWPTTHRLACWIRAACHDLATAAVLLLLALAGLHLA